MESLTALALMLFALAILLSICRSASVLASADLSQAG